MIMEATKRMVDVAAVGIYMIGLQLGQVMGLLGDSFNKVYAPWIMKNLSNKIDAKKLGTLRRAFLQYKTAFVMSNRPTLESHCSPFYFCPTLSAG